MIYTEPKIKTYNKAQRIRWLWPVERLGMERMTNMALYRSSIDRRKKDRPRKIWLDHTLKDLRSINARECKGKAWNRKK